MSDEREKPPVLNVTERPPSGSADIYSADTKVGKAPDDILALVRAAEEAAAQPSIRDDAPTRVAKVDVPAAVAEALHGSSKTPTDPPPIPVHRAEVTSTTKGGLPPAVSIVLIFAATVIVMAALVR